jgi:hypothetical protein
LTFNNVKVRISNIAIFQFPIVLEENPQLYETIKAEADPHTPIKRVENLYKIDK